VIGRVFKDDLYSYPPKTIVTLLQRRRTASEASKKYPSIKKVQARKMTHAIPVAAPDKHPAKPLLVFIFSDHAPLYI